MVKDTTRDILQTKAENEVIRNAPLRANAPNERSIIFSFDCSSGAVKRYSGQPNSPLLVLLWVEQPDRRYEAEE